MAGQWKPGTVAMVTYEGRTRIALHGDQGWSFAFDAEVRPLVVIDPTTIPHLREFGDDPAEALRVVADGVEDAAGDDLDATMAILRWLADLMPKPPKPDEPTGLGAVVRDDVGRIYTRYETAGGPTKEPQPWWQSANGPEHDVVRRFGWADIDAVEVLSEGWSE